MTPHLLSDLPGSCLTGVWDGFTWLGNRQSCTSGRGFLVAQTVKNLPAMQEAWVLSLGWQDPREKGIAICSSILAWRIPWQEEPGKL